MTQRPGVPAQLPQAWTAAIVDAGGAPVGLGVLVKPRHVVTCAHVVCRALGLPDTEPVAPAVPVSIEAFGSFSPVPARVIAWHPADASHKRRLQDICLLEFADDSLPLATWQDLLAQEPRRGNAVRTFGYPVPVGKVSTGSVLAGQVRTGWWQLNPPDRRPSSFTPIGPGFSGSLAWDMAEDKAVGIIVATSTTDGASFLIPCATLYEAWTEARLPTAVSLQAAVRARANVTASLADATPGHDVFLCHSGTDKPVVRELAAALRARRLRPWLDEDELAPGRPWQEAIEKAVATVHSAAVLWGPSGIGPWADREMRAFLEEFVRRRIPIIPVLLPGAPADPELPPFLRAFTWVDLRAGGIGGGDGLDRLYWGITGQRASAAAAAAPAGERAAAPAAAAPGGEKPPAGRLFTLWNVPLLPDAHLPRRELGALKAALMSPEASPLAVTGQRARQAVQGMGGVGKTVLAAALARDPDVRRAFPGGVFWLTLGQAPEDPIAAQARLAAALGGQETTLASVEDGRARLRELMAERAALLVLDDVWEAAHAHPFNVVGERGRLLVTTRKQEVTNGLGAESRSLGELPAPQALDLLARYAGIEAAALPAEATAIARECGELPLALAMVGAQLRGRPASRWKTALERLRGADLARLKAELPGYPHASMLAAIDVSVADLDPTLRQRYLDLAVFPEDAAIPEATLLTYWAPDGATEGDVQDTVDTFVARSLARRDGEGRLGLHDLQHDFVRARAAGGGAGFHARLVSAYRATTPGGLHAGPNDGYYFQRIATHLAAAEGRGALRSLLLDPRWLAAKLGAAGTPALVADFDLLDSIDADSPPRLTRDAVRLSAHVLDQRPPELAGQLIGRLGGLAASEPDLRRLCSEAARLATRPALLPLWARLDAPGGALLRTFEGHQAAVSAVAMSGDAKTALSGSDDKTLKLWDLASGKLLRTFEGHQAAVSAVAMSGDAKTALSGSDDKTLKLWDLASGKLLRTFEGHQATVSAVAMSGDGKTALSGSSDTTLKLWDLTLGKLLRTLEVHHALVNYARGSAEVMGDAKTVLSDFWDDTPKLGDLTSGELVRTFEVRHARISAVAMSGDGKTALSGSDDNALRLWDLASGELLRSFEGHQAYARISAVAMSGDGKTALSCSSGSTLKLWDLASGNLLRTFQGHHAHARVSAVAMSGDGKTALSGSSDSSLKLWDVASGKLLRSFEGHQAAVFAVAMSGKTALSGSWDNTLRLWDVASGKLLRSFEGHQAQVSAVAIGGDCQTVLSGSHDDTLKLWDVASGKLLHSFKGHQARVRAVAMSGDAKTALSGSDDKTLKLWDVASGKLLRSFGGHQAQISAVAMSGDAKTALSGAWDKTLKLWDLASGELLRSFDGHQDWVRAVVMSDDAKTAVSGSDDKTLKLWDLASGELLRSFDGHRGPIRAVAMSRDAKTAVSGSDDKTLKLWDLASGKLLRSFEGHRDWVRAVAMSRDAKTAVSGSDDKTLKLWDLASGALLASFTADASIASVAITPDVHLVFAGDARGRVQAFEIAR